MHGKSTNQATGEAVDCLKGRVTFVQARDGQRGTGKIVAAAVEARRTVPEEEAAVEEAGKPIPFTRRVDRRVRYWVDRAAIGSKLFVMEVMSRARPNTDMKKRRFSRAADMAHCAAPLCCYKPAPCHHRLSAPPILQGKGVARDAPDELRPDTSVL